MGNAVVSGKQVASSFMSIFGKVARPLISTFNLVSQSCEVVYTDEIIGELRPEKLSLSH